MREREKNRLSLWSLNTMVIECDFIEPIDNWFTASGGHTIASVLTLLWIKLADGMKKPWYRIDHFFGLLANWVFIWKNHRCNISNGYTFGTGEKMWGGLGFNVFFLHHIWPLLMAVMVYIKWGWRRFAKAMVIILHPAGAYPIEWPIGTTPFCNSPERIDRNAYVRCLLTLSMK